MTVTAKFRVLVTGGRDYPHAQRVREELAVLLTTHGALHVIHGACPTGADKHADDWVAWTSEHVGRGTLTVERFQAKWSKHGRRAGPMRNREMVWHGEPHLCLAFPGGRGTADCIRACREAGVPVREVTT